MNIAQQLFLVLFSILYGVMLQSLSGLQPFPLARTFRGYIDPNGKLKTQFDGCEKKSNSWLICMWRKRVFWSLILLNGLPLVYLWGILNILNWVQLSSNFPLIPDLIYLGIIFWSALGVFGFYRLYHALFTWKWKSLFCDVIDNNFKKKRPISYDARAHFIWACIYLLPPVHFLIFIICFLN